MTNVIPLVANTIEYHDDGTTAKLTADPNRVVYLDTLEPGKLLLTIEGQDNRLAQAEIDIYDFLHALTHFLLLEDDFGL